MDIQEYKKAVEEIDRLEKLKEAEQKKISNREEVIRARYWKLENCLEERKRKEQLKIDRDKESLKKDISDQETPHFEIINKVKRFFELIDVHQGSRETNFEVYYYSDRDEEGNYVPTCERRRKIEIDPIDVICNDEFKAIAAYVLENRKPKNKYTLAICGKSIFGPDGFNRFFESSVGRYYLHVNSHIDSCNIEFEITTGSDIEQLTQYYEKKKPLILKDYKEKHRLLEQEFLQAIELFDKQKDWQLIYWENKRDHYKQHYRDWKESDKYNEAITKIEQLQQNHKKQLTMV